MSDMPTQHGDYRQWATADAQEIHELESELTSLSTGPTVTASENEPLLSREGFEDALKKASAPT